MYLACNKYRAWSLELYFGEVCTYLELLDISVRHLIEKISKEKSWNKGSLHECYYSVFPLQLLILSIIVLQAMTNPFTLKTINGMFEMVCGRGRCVYINFFLISHDTHLAMIPWHPIYALGSICILNCNIAPLQSWNRFAPYTPDSPLMPAADTEAMPNQLTEQNVDGPQRCFSAPAVMRGQKEKKQGPLTTWGGCQGIKYCSEFQYEVWNESELQLIHWKESSRLHR